MFPGLEAEPDRRKAKNGGLLEDNPGISTFHSNVVGSPPVPAMRTTYCCIQVPVFDSSHTAALPVEPQAANPLKDQRVGGYSYL